MNNDNNKELIRGEKKGKSFLSSLLPQKKDSGSCVGSYSVSGYTRSDGTKVGDYTRTCGAKH